MKRTAQMTVQDLARAGGIARARALSKERRVQIAQSGGIAAARNRTKGKFVRSQAEKNGAAPLEGKRRRQIQREETIR
jgi:hypothetical protein